MQRLNNIPASLPPLSNLPVRQLNNAAELNQKRRGGLEAKNCNVQHKDEVKAPPPSGKEVRPISPVKPAKPVPAQSSLVQSKPAQPVKPLPTQPVSSKPPKPRPPPLPPISTVPLAKRCVRVKFDVEDDNYETPPPIPPRSNACTPTSPPLSTTVVAVTVFPVPVSPPPVTTPPLSPGHMLVSAHNPLYDDDSMDN